MAFLIVLVVSALILAAILFVPSPMRRLALVSEEVGGMVRISLRRRTPSPSPKALGMAAEFNLGYEEPLHSFLTYEDVCWLKDRGWKPPLPLAQSWQAVKVEKAREARRQAIAAGEVRPTQADLAAEADRRVRGGEAHEVSPDVVLSSVIRTGDGRVVASGERQAIWADYAHAQAVSRATAIAQFGFPMEYGTRR